MQSTSLAPELSATRSRLSCWIMASPLLPGPLEDLDHPPVLALGERPGLGDPDPVADTGVVGLVVGEEALGPLHRLGVPRVADPLDDGDDGGLVHDVGHHQALAHLAPVGPDLFGARRRGALLSLLSHQADSSVRSAASAASISRSRRTVRIRATSLRTWPRRAELSCLPVASWNRRLNSSSLLSDSLPSSSSSLRSRSSLTLVIRRAPPPARCAARSGP